MLSPFSGSRIAYINSEIVSPTNSSVIVVIFDQCYTLKTASAVSTAP
ncbi:hypothetical protein SOHN41_02917 [Shewanella sp. HN-41]|nr:hypothetical protein SOHN41_02917 [Shewanella sp. HN-41]